LSHVEFRTTILVTPIAPNFQKNKKKQTKGWAMVKALVLGSKKLLQVT
jgi:hypothetical protein